MRTVSGNFLAWPRTRLGWWAVELAAVFVAMFISTTTGFVHFFGIFVMGVGVVAGILILVALIWKRERSWLLWLMLLPGLFAIVFALGEILVPH
jgi:hypothetical protein